MKILKYLPCCLLLFQLSLFAASSEKPNIVWLTSEDNSPEYLRLYNESGAPMPTVERLAENGLTFTHAFSNAPVCSVARSTIISGCYTTKIGAQYHRKFQPAPMPEGLRMFPYYLKQAGYYTANNKKEDYNLIKGDDVWDESSSQATWKNRKPGQPFFYVQNYETTHESKVHFDWKSAKETIDPKELESIKLPPYFPDTELFRYTYYHYLQLHKKLDSQLGEVIKDLEDNGLMDDTIIFYYGDHGGVLPRSKTYLFESGLRVPLVIYIPEKWKHLAYNAKSGSKVDGFVNFVDLAATMLNLVGIEVPETMDGKAFLGKDISLASVNERNTTFANSDRYDEKYEMVRSVRVSDLKYIRSYDPYGLDALYNEYRYRMEAYKQWWKMHCKEELLDVSDCFFQQKATESLYDLSSDPYETNNLAYKPEYSEKLQAMRGILRQHLIEQPDLGFYPEAYLLKQALSNPVDFGQQHKKELSRLMDIADLSLLSFPEAKSDLRKALKSKNPWERYWGFIVCSSFKNEAAEFYDLAQKASVDDANLLVRLRAVEFLALSGIEDPGANLVDILSKTSSRAETYMVLNSVVMLGMVNPEFIPKIDMEEVNYLDKNRKMQLEEFYKFIHVMSENEQ